MKTSNKLLIGAFVVILITMIYSNLRIKYSVNDIKNKQDIQYNQRPDSISPDTVSTKISIQVNQ